MVGELSPLKSKQGDSRIALLLGNPVPFPEASTYRYTFPSAAPLGPVLLEGVVPEFLVQFISSPVVVFVHCPRFVSKLSTRGKDETEDEHSSSPPPSPDSLLRTRKNPPSN